MAEIYRENSPMTLRQEAIARVREMQRRAQFAAEQHFEAAPKTAPSNETPNNNTWQNMQQKADNTPQRRDDNTPPTNILGQLFGQHRPNERQKGAAPNGIADLLKRQGFGDGIGGLGDAVQNTVSSVSQPLSQLLESFGIDGEKLIILMVMWAVFNQNKENKTLLMALGYLLL